MFGICTLSADKGFTPAEYLLGKLLYKVEAVSQDIPKALAYPERAAEKENPYAAYLAGKICLTEDAVKDVQKAIRRLTASAGHGNQYAGQLLHSIGHNRNRSAAMGTFRLLHHISRIIQNRLEDERRGKDGAHIDRKLRRRIQDKNEAPGIKQE